MMAANILDNFNVKPLLTHACSHYIIYFVLIQKRKKLEKYRLDTDTHTHTHNIKFLHLLNVLADI